jgi:diamine N-acetyltransferase
MEHSAPAVSLREVTPQNFSQVVNLSVLAEQKHFVSSNQASLAEAYVFPGRHPLAIYADEFPVGFLMYVVSDKGQQFWIFRLMIDAEHQMRGYGRAAMLLLLDRMKALPGCSEVYISYDLENEVARALYLSLGFVVTGEIISGEEVARLVFS